MTAYTQVVCNGISTAEPLRPSPSPQHAYDALEGAMLQLLHATDAGQRSERLPPAAAPMPQVVVTGPGVEYTQLNRPT